MAEKNLKARIQQKHDFEINWQKAVNFIPKSGELIVYDSEVDINGNVLTLSNGSSVLPEGRLTPYSFARFKIGDGISVVNILPFSTEYDWNASEGEAGYVKNRTHYEETTVVNEPLNITWDGNTEGLVSVDVEDGVAIYKLSDIVLTNEQARTMKVVINTGEEFLAEDEWATNESQGLIAEDFAVFGGFSVFVVRKDNVSVGGMITIPEAGIWVAPQSNTYYPTSLTTTEPVPQTKTVVHKLDKKFLPDDVGGGTSIDVTAEVGQTIIVKEVDANGKPTKWESADYQPRTHYEEGSNVTLFDGSCYVRNTRTIVELEPAFILVSGKKYTVTLDGVIYEFEAYIDEHDCVNVGAPYNYDEREFDFSEIPLSISCYDDDGLVSDFACNVGGDHTLTVVENNEIIHRLDEKYIPHTIARIADIPTKTSELVNDSNFITSDALSGLGGGDMLKATYDTDGDGIVDNAEKLGGILAEAYAKKTDIPTIPTKVSAFENDKGYLTSYTETDPTVPSWAKASSKPTYTKSEVGLGNVDNVKQYSASNPPPYPVTSINGKTGAVQITASDLGLSGAMRFLGTSATNIVDNSTTQTISVNGSTITAQNGNVVLYGNKEFVWNNTFWEELGDEGSHALKSVKIEGTGYLTGGGTLEANRTIDINSATKIKIDGAVQKSEAAGYNDILTKTIAASTYQPISIIKNTTTITPIEVKALMDEGKAFAISHTDATYGSMLFTSFAYSQALNGIVASVMFETAGAKFCAQLSGSLTPNTWAFSAFQLAGAEDIPISLPNPNALTINGMTYDGSEAVSVGNTVHYIVGDSTTAGTWTGTCAEITKYYDGLTVAYKTNIAGISGGTTLNINGLGAISVRRNASTAVTTTYPVGSVIILTYSTTDGVGYWLTADYDVNTKTTTGSSNKTATKMFLIGGTSQSSSGVTTYSNTKCYIGTDNRLYSNGAVVPNTDEINALIDTKLGVIENGSY